MKNITEDFILYLWKFRLFALEEEEGITINDTGIRNLDAGPDFFNAKIRISKSLWVGNVEMHVYGEDWYRHKHQQDPSYNNVILHVVWDKPVKVHNQHGREIPTLVLKKRVFPHVLAQFHKLDLSLQAIPCGKSLKLLEEQQWKATLENYKILRLQQRAQELLELQELNKSDWEETLYIIVAKSFGFKVNALPFMMLARSVPLKWVRNHRHHLQELEALFLGGAGLLNTIHSDSYTAQLQANFRWLGKRYQLQPISMSLWKFSKMRPVNFPTLRIVQFCAFLHHNESLFSSFLHVSEKNDWANLFEGEPSAYWKDHYRPGVKADKPVPHRIGRDAITTILLNAIVPFLFVYGQFANKPMLVHYALEILATHPPENNRVIRIWQEFGKAPQNAGESQAMMELYHRNCVAKQCLNCSIGHQLMKRV